METAVYILAALLLPLSWGRPVVPSTPPDDISQNHARLLMAAAVLVWAAILIPLTATPFLSDDYGFVERYRSLGDIAAPWQFFRPAFAAVFVMLNGAGGGSPFPFHLVSLALHATSAWLVKSLVLRLFQSRVLAALTFAVFLVSPVQLEPVLWTAGMQDLLWTAFLLAALCIYARGTTLSAGRIGATSGFLILALLAKETAVCALFLIPSVDWVLRRSGRALRAYGAFGLVFLTYLIARLSVDADVASVIPPTITQYSLKQFFSIPYRVFSHPWSSVVEPPGLVAFAIAAGLTTLLVTAAFKADPRRLLVGPAVVVVSTVPLFQYLWVTPELHNARYLYFPAIGWAFLLAQFAVSSARDPRGQAFIGCAIAVVCVVFLVRNTPPWRQAAQLIDAMAVDVAARGDGRHAASAWQARTGVAVEMRDGIPVSSQGVDILRNSYEEFVRYYRER
jgi:hypothetical protein